MTTPTPFPTETVTTCPTCREAVVVSHGLFLVCPECETVFRLVPVTLPRPSSAAGATH